MLYAYKKATPQAPSPGHTIPRYLRFLPTLISSTGLAVIAFVVWPIINYRFSSTSLFFSNNLLSPSHYNSFVNGSAQAPTILSGIDYTKARNWFDTKNENVIFTTRSGDISSYTLSIPSLNIEQVEVGLEDENLNLHLVHYPQTALPGQKGSPVIFGHSTLPQFFNPQDYASIFSTLPNIKQGEEVIITYDKIQYVYQVTKVYEVKPSDVYVLRQDYNQTGLKLITCVPPGTKLRRLVVESKLIKK